MTDTTVSTTDSTTRAMLNALEVIARKAGAAIMEIYESGDFTVDMKSDDSPLTTADRAAHAVIVDGLKAMDAEFGATPILSEEDADISWDVRSDWTRYWLVDPLDGTKEFIKRNGEFTVNIALIEQGVPTMGVVYAPAIETLYVGAQQGEGQTAIAEKQVGEGERQAIAVSDVPSSTDSWRIVGSRSHQSEEFKAFVADFAACDIVAMGSSLKLCLVAEGAADLYPRLGPTCEWDTGAAHAVVEAAGGQVLNAETRQALRYNQHDSVLNPYFIVCAEPAAPWA
ncbi:3'(2'),5'-bisphosphate nucleotidase CysQ [Cobetia sp. LC6]|uniref:3'(2'),5'-bisphosphate nucleotidase CysQ n=1 Tax=Cobetia sp. LC6 TaxID=3050947 RepID=UPI00255282F2|nr:3'(2'),5'-bisphosphate nucleotidase CysQ [Cobetia sp. LC6]MDL2193043.1 3'(2'),5'-bisphosphate nucleotidase CysQ [Cobetia sp. LC6]